MADLNTLIPLQLSVGIISNILEFLKRVDYKGLDEANAAVDIEKALTVAVLSYDAKPSRKKRSRKKPR